MPRSRTKTVDDVVDRAMHHFWHNGYCATSIDALVNSIGVSRHILYGDFGGKHGLFTSCLDRYRDTVVSPAFAQVEGATARLATIAHYYEFQISRAESLGFPGPGCLIANTQTEVAPHHEAIANIVDAHNARLLSGFQNALSGELTAGGLRSRDSTVEALATTLVVFTNGLWSFSRTVSNASPLRSSVSVMLQLVEQRIAA